MAKMNKHDLIKAVASKAGINQLAAKAALDGLSEIIAELHVGDELPIHGIGKFLVKETAARTGRNPATGDTVQIPAKRRLAFKASKATV